AARQDGRARTDDTVDTSLGEGSLLRPYALAGLRRRPQQHRWRRQQQAPLILGRLDERRRFGGRPLSGDFSSPRRGGRQRLAALQEGEKAHGHRPRSRWPSAWYDYA